MSRTPSVAERHREWLTLVDTEGPFLSVPALRRVYPQGMPSLDGDRRALLVEAKRDFEKAYEQWVRDGDVGAFRAPRDAWVHTVLHDVMGWGDRLRWGTPVTAKGPARVSERGVTVEATGALQRDDDVAALVLVVEPVESLRDLLEETWSGSPIDRMEALLRSSGVPIGVVTDGRWWALVSAPPGGMAASGVVDSQTWVEEAAVRDAFLELLSRRRLVGGAEEDRLPAMFVESVAAAEEITEALGTQVRKAVELLVSAFSEAAEDARREGRPDPLPSDRGEVYEAAVTVMMRIVFLLFAEEHGLLPQSRLYTGAYAIADRLDALDARVREEGPEALDATHMTWHRLLATSQALYSGVTFEDMRIPSYGGSLFDAERYPFLVARDERGALRVRVSDRVMLEVLRAVQVAQLKRGGDARRISFRTVDVEQIGYIYEGLLGYTSVQVDEVTLGLTGTDGQEPEFPLAALEDLRGRFRDDARLADELLKEIKRTQPAAKPPSKAAITKALRSAGDVEDAERALLTVTRDRELIDRLRPFIALIRRDLRDRPVVIRPGGLVVAETPSRANSGAHYTPKSLAREVVTHALEPLVYSPGPYQTNDRDQWVPLSSDQLLELKVADIACGSGAFLVAAAEYLAERLVEAWHREGLDFGTPAEVRTRAIRKVVARCLYGADINEMAVEMCKLSLWLVSLDPKLPFSFVDDKVLHGNSLLGLTDARQLTALHIRPPRTTVETLESAHASVEVERTLERAASLRRALASEVDESDPERSTATKRRLMRELEEVTAKQALLADGVIAAGLPLGGKPGRALDERYDDLRHAVARAFPERGEGDDTWLRSIVDRGLTPTVETDYERWKPLHWVLAVPDVMARGGFDAVIGNPPFLGGQKLSGAMGAEIRDWFVNVLAEGARGSADLVAYFFLRATDLLRSGGTLGLIATNTIAQGDTREVGLDRMVASGFEITRAIQSRSWPAKGANLEYAAVWGTTGTVSDGIARVADDLPVRRVSTLLEPVGRVDGRPARLAENAGIAFQGCIVRGIGFVVTPQEAAQWIASDPRNSEVLAPYLNGDDLNGRPDCSPSRWVIDFADLSLDRAQTFHLPFQRVRELVYPERLKVNQERVRRVWWQHEARRPSMRRAIGELDEVLVIALVSKSVMPARVPANQVFSHKLGVFATTSYADQATLSSSAHYLWTVRNSSTMRTDINYSPSDVFLTFSRPVPTERLHQIGRTLDGERREIMLRRGLGLTKLYNLVNDPDVKDSADPDVRRLRDIHVEIDEAVLEAYGWDDITPNHGFHTYRQMTRWTFSPEARIEILDRLLEENHRRAAAQGTAPEPAADEADDLEDAE
jgi:hypothetical protein